MTLEQAIAVANEIEKSERFELMAIGRFVPMAELQTAERRWGVSLWLIGSESPVVIWNVQKWVEFRERTKPSDEPMRDAKHRQQLSLF